MTLELDRILSEFKAKGGKVISLSDRDENRCPINRKCGKAFSGNCDMTKCQSRTIRVAQDLDGSAPDYDNLKI